MNALAWSQFRAVLIAVTAVGLTAPSLTAQDRRDLASPTTTDELIRRQRLLDEQLDERRQELAPLTTLMDWQWGGWLEYYVFSFDDGIQSQRVLQRPALALWTRLQLDGGAHEIFARMRMTYEYFRPGDEFVRRRDWIGPNLDRGWYRIDIGRALRITEPSDPYQVAVRAGRQEVRFGTGYTLDLPLDAVTIDAEIQDFRITGLIGKTTGSYPNIDRSAPVSGHSNRHFFGVEVRYEGLGTHVPFAYVVWQNDRTDERPKDPFQNYAYDSEYYGLGARGSIAHNFNYWTEWVLENGDSFGDGQIVRRDSIDAWAWDVGAEYIWDHPTHPRVAAEYMFASGDPGRRFSPTSAAGGNRGDREDSGFVEFGFRDTGVASGLVRSNLHIWRAGASWIPFPQHRLFRDFEAGTNWFLYHKHHRRAAISDTTADTYSGYVGWEMDYFLNWRLASDLAWTARWGVFFPGQAFSDRDTRHFFFTGITWSF